uniref:SAC domain-containing protein n=1 Tax=Chenopodium quinoa TaxID=63459 RepID=A0A803MK73_CHEQI
MEEKEIGVEEESPTSSATPNFRLIDKMELLEFKDKYVIRAVNSPNQGFSASRLDGHIQPLTSNVVLGTPGKTTKICGVVGTIQLVSGTRMWRRGANLQGDAANFIETEQLLESKNFKSSFLQVRGSIPLLWEQIVDLSYKPRLNIINHQDTSHVVERHFHDLSQRYGEILALDLTDEYGDEGKLSNAFAAEMEKLPSVRYIPFRFHTICGKSNFDNLHLLYDEISDEIGKQGYFLVDSEGHVLEEQRGVIRSNCIDCLDRTNVTQSYLARKSLDLQLQRVGIFTLEDTISILWVEQGDELSLEYTGTHALKRDLVRYGKQTFGGLITDVSSSGFSIVDWGLDNDVIFTKPRSQGIDNVLHDLSE